MLWSQLPLELADRIFATLGLLDLSRIVAVSRFCHDRLPTAITACSLRLKLGGYANAVGLRSTNTLLAHLDAALPRLPRAIVVTWLADFDWRVRLHACTPGGVGTKGEGQGGVRAERVSRCSQPSLEACAQVQPQASPPTFTPTFTLTF